MADEEVDLAKLKALGSMSDQDLGETEEDVKIHFAVPLLHALGHTRLRFEHKGIDVLLKDGLPRGSTVVVETKRPEASLDQHLGQLERYSLEERSLLSLLTNGRILRLYAPLWNQARSFAETLLWEFPRGELARSHNIKTLASVLSRQALAGEWAPDALRRREGTLAVIWASAEGIRREHRERRQQLEQRLREIDQHTAGLAAERRQHIEELDTLDPHERDAIRRLFRPAAVPLVPTGQFGDVACLRLEPAPTPPPPNAPQSRRPLKPREWTPERLYKRASVKQKRIFAAFVQRGRRTLGTREIAERTGLTTHTIAAALSSLRTLSTKWGFAPLIEFERTCFDERERRGNLYTIAPRYWPLIRKLYRRDARPGRAKKPSTD